MYQRHKNMRMKQLELAPALATATRNLCRGYHRRKDFSTRLFDAQAPRLRTGHFVNLTV